MEPLEGLVHYDTGVPIILCRCQRGPLGSVSSEDLYYFIRMEHTILTGI